ncbi:MAG: carboxypeptidase-like regulatory domain-containing protein [Planctomycetota bacterium]
MRWTLVLVLLVVAGAVAFMLLSGGERAGGERGAEGAAVEARESGAREALVAPTIAELSSDDNGPSHTRSELPDDAPRVRGVVRVEDGGELGEDIELGVDAYTSSTTTPEQFHVPVAPDGTFTFVPPRDTSYVMLEPCAETLYTPTKVRAVPGDEVVVMALRVVEPDLENALVVSGVVLDQHGQPFAGATIYTADPGSSTWEGAGEESDADGRFELTGLARARWRIGISSDESFGRTHLDIDGTSVDVHGLVFTLERGGCIEGRVRWPDGTFVSEFEAWAKSERMSRMSTFEGGEFRLCGLSEALDWKIEITAESGRTTGSASVSGVRTGGPKLDLVLEARDTFAVEVVVRGPEDELVQHATVWGRLSDADRSGTHAEGNGQVLLGGLTTGVWKIEARAEGYEDAEQEVTLALSSPAIVFRLERSARARGVVLDAEGNAVPGAEVSIVDARGGRSQDTDEHGRFEIAGSPGVNVLRAKRIGLGASPAHEVTFVGAQVTDGVVLRLETAARLEGRVLDEQGDPLRDVWVHARSGESSHTGEDGTFVFECLAAETHEVTASHEGRRVRVTVTLIGGQTSTVELRMRAPDPVRVHGRATLAGKPYTGSMWFFGQESSADAKCDADGRFQVTLQFPGPFEVVRFVPEGRSWRLDLTIPDVAEHELTLDLDDMRQPD